MNRQIILIALMGCFAASAFAAPSWETDFKRAAKKADRKDRYMLLDFTGSDWCGWCIKLNKEVFDKSDFKDYARKNLILVEVDFPRMKKQKKSLEEQNADLALEYGIRGYPTIIILAPDGTLVAKTGYKRGGAEKYVEHLKKLIYKYENAPHEDSTAKDRKKGREDNREGSGR
ncbi:MAG: thioredoxin family protein [Lentisphaeria bacterium]